MENGSLDGMRFEDLGKGERVCRGDGKEFLVEEEGN